MPSFWENLRFPGGSTDQPGQSYDEAQGAESQDMIIYVSHPPPSAGADFPAIIVAQEAFGVNRHIEKVCDKLAAAGIERIVIVTGHLSECYEKLAASRMGARQGQRGKHDQRRDGPGEGEYAGRLNPRIFKQFGDRVVEVFVKGGRFVER